MNNFKNKQGNQPEQTAPGQAERKPEQHSAQQDKVNAAEDRDVRVNEAKHDKDQNQAINASKHNGQANVPEGASRDEKDRLLELRDKKDKTPEEQEELRNLEEPTLGAA